METQPERDALREVLAGNRGHCEGYKRAGTLGHALEPFAWLSSDSPEGDHERLAGELRAFTSSHEAVGFEAWERDDEGWQLVFSGKVRVIYVEVDARRPLVRALLQRAPNA